MLKNFSNSGSLGRSRAACPALLELPTFLKFKKSE